MKITLAYPADPDSAFAMHALASGLIDTGDLEIIPAAKNIMSLNNSACRGEYDVTAISAHAFAYVRNHYMLSKSGSIFGKVSGPKILASEPLSTDQLAAATVAIAGTTSTAYLALTLYNPSGSTMMLPADKIIPAIKSGLVKFGLFAHSDQLSSQKQCLSTVLDLGQWWAGKGNNQPLPLHLMAIKKTLPAEIASDVSKLIARSIEHAMNHRQQALAAANLCTSYELLDQVEPFVDEYVTDLSVDMGQAGLSAIEELLTLGQNQGLVEAQEPLGFI